jgi:endoglucanase
MTKILITVVSFFMFTLCAYAQETPYTPTGPAGTLQTFYYGVNLEGGEFSPGPGGTNGTNYFMPTLSNFQYFQGLGFSIIRVPVDQARLQSQPYGPINTTHANELKTVLDYAYQTGMYVMIDPHTYGKDWMDITSAYQVIDVDKPAGSIFPYIDKSEFADFWRRMTILYRNYPNVIWGLQNEPNVQGTQVWHDIAVAAVYAIRTVEREAGVPYHIISIPGTFFTTAATWVSSGNAAVWAGYADPYGGPFWFEMHQYLDANFSGTSNQCVAGSGSSNLTAATNWLNSNGYKGFIGEFDWYNTCTAANQVSTSNGNCVTEGNALLTAMTNSAWAGWAWWGSGNGAGDNCVNLLPGSNGFAGTQVQTTMLTPFLPGQGGGGGNISYVGTSEVSNASGTASLGAPSGTQNGDVMLAEITIYNGTIASTPSGWTQLGSNTISNDHSTMYVYSHVASSQGTDTWSGGSYIGITYRAYRGVTGVHATSGFFSGYGASSGSVPAITETFTSPEWDVLYMASGHNASFTLPSGFVNVVTTTDTWNQTGADMPVTAVPGTQSFTDTPDGDVWGIQITLH